MCARSNQLAGAKIGAIEILSLGRENNNRIRLELKGLNRKSAANLIYI